MTMISKYKDTWVVLNNDEYICAVGRLVSSDLKVPPGPLLYYFLEKVPVEAILPLNCLYLYRF